MQLKAIITHAELQEECNNHHNVTQLKCNLELCTLKGEIIQVHLYCRSNQHLPPLHHVKEMIRRLSNGYFDLKKRNEKINNNDKHVFLKICMLGHYVSYCRFNFSQATVKYGCNKVSYMLKVCNIVWIIRHRNYHLPSHTLPVQDSFHLCSIQHSAQRSLCWVLSRGLWAADCEMGGMREKELTKTWPTLQPEGGYIFQYLNQSIQESQIASGFSTGTKSSPLSTPRYNYLTQAGIQVKFSKMCPFTPAKWNHDVRNPEKEAKEAYKKSYSAEMTCSIKTNSGAKIFPTKTFLRVEKKAPFLCLTEPLKH